MDAANREITEEGTTAALAGRLMPVSGHGKMYVCRTNGILPFTPGSFRGIIKENVRI